MEHQNNKKKNILKDTTVASQYSLRLEWRRLELSRHEMIRFWVRVLVM